MVTLVAGVVSFLQFNATKESADAALKAIEIARDARDDNDISAGDTLIQMKAQGRVMQRNAMATEQSVATSKRAMEHSEQQSRESLDASISASRTDQRAWLFEDQMKMVGQFSAGQPAAFEIVFKNGGKTPANDVKVSCSVEVKMGLIITSAKSCGAEATSVGPGAGHTQEIRIRNTWTQGDIANFQSGIYSITIIGELTYRDVFPGTPLRKTGFCAYYTASDAPFLSLCKGSYME
jgi:hypothetical protein